MKHRLTATALASIDFVFVTQCVFGVLQYMGTINETHTSLAIEKSKIRTDKLKTRNISQKDNFLVVLFPCYIF